MHFLFGAAVVPDRRMPRAGVGGGEGDRGRRAERAAAQGRLWSSVRPAVTPHRCSRRHPGVLLLRFLLLFRAQLSFLVAVPCPPSGSRGIL
eukprot:18702-Rhodomonas_salina.1